MCFLTVSWKRFPFNRHDASSSSSSWSYTLYSVLFLLDPKSNFCVLFKLNWFPQIVVSFNDRGEPV